MNPDLLNISTALPAWIREQILATAREHVLAFPTFAAALRDCSLHMELSLAEECLAARIGRATLPAEYRNALIRAVRAEAHRQAEKALDLDNDNHPEAWGNPRKALEAALDRDRDDVAACDDCDGQGRRGFDKCHCHGGLCVAPEDVATMLARLADEAIAACATPAQREPALVEIEMSEPAKEVA